MSDLEKEIDAIAGGEWFHYENREVLMKHANFLINLGLPKKCVIETIYELWSAIADEFGG